MNEHGSAPAGGSARRDQYGSALPRPGWPAVGDARAWWGAGVAVAAVGWGAQQFAPLLLMYQAELGVSTTTVQAAFGLYVLGLIPGLLLGGPVSDRYGRRRVMLPTLVASVAGTVLLICGGTGAEWLFAGRLVAGVASGAAFSSGAAWIKELSAAGSPEGAKHGPRRLTVAMSVGFGLGPLVSGVLVLGAGYGCCQVCGLLEVQRLAQPAHLAGLTAAYQAVSYLGFVAPFPLAAAARVVPASALLVGVAVLAALTLVWTTRMARLPRRRVLQTLLITDR